MIPNRGSAQRFAAFCGNIAAGSKNGSSDFDILEIVTGHGNREPDFSSEGGLLFQALTGYISASHSKALCRFAGTSVSQFCINTHQ
jgi:hypothetical protein